MSPSSEATAPVQPRAAATAMAPWLYPLWVVAAFLSALCGIGGGLFAVPMLHYLAGMELRRAVATSLCLVLVLSVVATGVELGHAESALVPWVVGVLVVGGAFGARLGFRVAQRVRPRWLKAIFAVVLALAAVRVFGMSAAARAAGSAAAPFGPANAGAVLAIGLGGGFVAPLLGVGGGLIVVPALFLSIPELDYLGARACSLGMTIVVAAQSVLLYARAGLIEGRVALRLAVLTGLGAAAGVLAVHGSGWAELARTVMATILVVVSLRFALDVLRAARG